MSDNSNRNSTDNIQDGLLLKEFMQAVRNDLVEAEQERLESDHDALFKVDSLEIEASVIVKKKAKGKLGFNIQVVSVGADGGVEHEAAHRIILKLSAVDDVSTIGLLPCSMPLDNGDYNGERPSLGLLPVSLDTSSDYLQDIIHFEDEESEDENEFSESE